MDAYGTFPKYLDLAPGKEDYELEMWRKDRVDGEKDGEEEKEVCASVVCRVAWMPLRCVPYAPFSTAW